MHEQNNTDGPICKDCGKYTERIGTFSACANGYCDRFAIPVNNDGMTDEEAKADAIAPLIPEEVEADEDERQGDSDSTGFISPHESASYRSSMIDAGRGHLLS